MKCINCQTENKDSAKFCKGCGSPITAAAQQPDVQSKSCPDCQCDCKPEAKFCPKCGHKFSATAVEVSPHPAEKHAATNPQVTPVVDVAMPQETKSCPNCNNDLKLTAKFCGKCGFSLEQKITPELDKQNGVTDAPPLPVNHADLTETNVMAATAEETKPCPGCSNILNLAAKFCGKCGFSFGENTPHRTEKSHSIPATSPAAESQPSAKNEESQSDVKPHQSAINKSPEQTPPQASNIAKKPSLTPIISVAVLLVSAIGGGAYWWLKAKDATDPTVQTAQATATSSSAPHDPVPPVVTPDTKNPEAPITKNSPPTPIVTEKTATNTTTKSARSNPPAVRKEPVPATPRIPTPPPAPDVKLDSQSETMLSMGERMFSNKQYSAALDLSKQVLRQHPGNPRATRLKDSCQAEIARQQNELSGQLNGLLK